MKCLYTMYVDGDFGINMSGWIEIIKISIASCYSSFHNDQTCTWKSSLESQVNDYIYNKESHQRDYEMK